MPRPQILRITKPWSMVKPLRLQVIFESVQMINRLNIPGDIVEYVFLNTTAAGCCVWLQMRVTFCRIRMLRLRTLCLVQVWCLERWRNNDHDLLAAEVQYGSPFLAI